MKNLSLEAKKAYFAKTRKSNYVASLRLEGFAVQPSDATAKTVSRDVLIKRHSKTRS